MNVARLALLRGDLDAAISHSEIFIGNPDSESEGHFIKALALAELGHLRQSVECLKNATVLRSDISEYWAQLARIFLLLRRDQEASEAVQVAQSLVVTDALTHDTIGCVLTRLGDHEGALSPFRAAVLQEPKNPSYRYNLAAACGFTGRSNEARNHYEEILSEFPDDARSHYGLSILNRQSAVNNHITRLDAAIERAMDPSQVLKLRYSLAKELEDTGNYHRAFTILSVANADYKCHLHYNFEQDLAIFDSIYQAFGNTQPFARSNLEAAPIFVVGMPRTGTTLVERIISSHQLVASLGELQAMPLAIKYAARTRSRTVLDPKTLIAAALADPEELGRSYLLRSAQHHRSSEPRFVDKLPMNFFNIGYILRALPNARIICLHRNPMDTVWSNYKNLFSTGSPYYSYSYDLHDAAKYYVEFYKLLNFWVKLYPQSVIFLNYEALVHNQEFETRRMLEHCGLDWDPACLNFHENQSAVATPSAAQVRRTLNKEGIGRWLSYEAEMMPIQNFLNDQGIKFV